MTAALPRLGTEPPSRAPLFDVPSTDVPPRGAPPLDALRRIAGTHHSLDSEWPGEPVVFPNDPAASADLLDIAAVRRIAVEPALRPVEIGMVRDGAIDPRHPDPDHPESTLVLNGLHLTWPPLARLCRQLAAQLGHPVTANAYLTPARARGYGPHWDTHHVFLVQTHGAKTWRLSRPVLTDPLDQHRWTAVGFTDEQLAQVSQRPDLEIELTEGQTLFIPRGWVHHGHTSDRRSLHITLGVHVLTRHWLLRQLLRHAADDARLRAALPPGLPGQPGRGPGAAGAAQAPQAEPDAGPDAELVLLVRSCLRELAEVSTGPAAAAVRAARQLAVLGVSP